MNTKQERVSGVITDEYLINMINNPVECGNVDLRVPLKELQTLRAALPKVRAALEFYDDINRWMPTTHESTWDGIGCEDFRIIKTVDFGIKQVGGRTAHEALELLDSLEVK